MSINYTEQFETKKATTKVAGINADYRIDYLVRNPAGKPVDSITATIYQVSAEGETQMEKMSRVGNACVDVESNRSYFAIEKLSQVSAGNQSAIAAQYFSDVKSILTLEE